MCLINKFVFNTQRNFLNVYIGEQRALNTILKASLFFKSKHRYKIPDPKGIGDFYKELFK